MTRTPRVDKNGLKKGPWSKEEDDKLKAYIERYGHWNWREIPRFAGVARCGKSCRLRWMNYLRPNIKHGNFTKEEEDLIMQIHDKIGNKWAKIAAELPGRSDNEVKNYWHTHLKARTKNDQNDSKTMNHEDKNQCNIETNLMEGSDLGDHDEGISIQTYSNEYDDGNFWTDPFFADLDVVNSVIVAPDDYSDEFMWLTMDLYSQYHSQFMI